MNLLQQRLQSLRRRLRVVVTFREVCRILALVLAGVLGTALVDWRFHIPGILRAGVLVAVLATTAYWAFRLFPKLFRSSRDDLDLALRVEILYPQFQDSLASTVQFLNEPATDDRLSSTTLRRLAIEQTLERVKRVDFNPVVDTSGVKEAGLALVGAAAFTFIWVFFFPALAWTAFERLTQPFSHHPWPLRTQLDIQAPSRLARGQPFELRAYVQGVIPGHAVVEFDDLAPARHSYPVTKDKAHDQGLLIVRRDRVDKSFRFQIRANDAESDWQEVTVLPPPVLVPLEGRSSPQVRLQYPAYTGQFDLAMPDGLGNVDAVAGTRVSLRAGVDRPLARGWIEYAPEPRSVQWTAIFAALCSTRMIDLLIMETAGQTVAGRVPLQIDNERRVISVEFYPRISGMYLLHIEDAAGMGATRLFDLRVFPDPAPLVNLERPAPAHDSLEALTNADISVQIQADDPQFGLRRVWLDYRCGRTEPAQAMLFYDGMNFARALKELCSGLFEGAVPQQAVRFRKQHFHEKRLVNLAQIKHSDGSALREGDILALRAFADDFDEVTVAKTPGQSHEIILRVVSRPQLESSLNDAQAIVQQELLRTRKAQQEASRHVQSALEQWRATGRFQAQDLDHLLQAEQWQRQIRGRIGSPQEGLRAQVDRIQETIKKNHLPPSMGGERMATVAAELDRLIDKELDLIEPHLTNARKENVAAATKPSGTSHHLDEAQRHQREVDLTLSEMLKLLEPWGNINEIKGEAKAILQEQRQTQELTQSLNKETTRGWERSRLDPDQQASLDKAGGQQEKLAERLGELLDKMDRVSTLRRDQDAPASQALTEAAGRGKKLEIARQLKQAAQSIRANQLGEAQQGEQQALQSLEQVVQALDNQREIDLAQLRKKLEEIKDRLSDLSKRQDLLRKKVKEAGGAGIEERQRQLRRLARQQQQLQQETKDLVRELSRLRADQAKQLAENAQESMEHASQQLTRGEEPEEHQEESLDRLQNAGAAVAQKKREVEEELAREKIAKMGDDIKHIQERQAAATKELARLEKVARDNKEWDRATLSSLTDLADNEQALSRESDRLAKEKMTGVVVFASILAKAAEGMNQAAASLTRRASHLVEQPDTIEPDTESANYQRQASHRLDQLVAAIKTDQNDKGPKLPPDELGNGADDRAIGSRASGDGLPPLAQWKVLKMLQQEVVEATEKFAKCHPSDKPLSENDARLLRSLAESQREVTRLVDEMTKTAAGEGNQP